MLWEAAGRGDVEHVRTLLGSEVDLEWTVDKERPNAALGWTPLIVAAFHGNEEVVRLLVEAGANKDAKTLDLGATALIMAAENNNEAVVQLLLDAGADKDVKDNDGKTALDVANEEEFTPIVRMILQCQSKEG